MNRNTRSSKNTSLTNLGTIDIDDLGDESRSIVMLIRNDITEMKSHFETLLKKKDNEISKLKQDVTELQKELSKAKSMIDDADAFERKDTVILSGDHIPVAETGENCSEIVRTIVKDHLKINLPSESISVAHRMGRRPANHAPDRHNIVVKLVRRDLKHDLIYASRKQPKPTKLFIHESLTPARNSLLYALRQMRKMKLVKGCNSYEGKIFAYTASLRNGDRDVRHFISSFESLKSFCTQYVKQPLENFLGTWNH